VLVVDVNAEYIMTTMWGMFILPVLVNRRRILSLQYLNEHRHVHSIAVGITGSKIR
jgi:hypothetical protein